MSGLKCEVGLGNATQVMECQGSWEKVKMMIKEEVGNNWEAVQNIDMSGLFDDIKNKVDDLKESLGNILQKTTGDSRRKREAEENPTAEPEPEPEPSEEYYCIKQSLGGTTVKSCMPKVRVGVKTTFLLVAAVSGGAPDHGLQCPLRDGDSLCLQRSRRLQLLWLPLSLSGPGNTTLNITNFNYIHIFRIWLSLFSCLCTYSGIKPKYL